PLAGGPSTPQLAAAVAEAGGLGFLAAGYKTADAVRADIAALRELSDRPFGVNIFAPPGDAADDVTSYRDGPRAEAERLGAEPGDIGLLALLQLVGAKVDRPLVATGGLTTGRGIAGALAAGASAAALGSALMLTPEAATSAPHREALAADNRTALTRAFTGRT